MQEQIDDKPLGDLVNLLQEELEEETSTDELLLVDHTTHLYEELQPGYKVSEVLDPFWESFCQKKIDEDGGLRQMVEYLKVVVGRKTNKCHKPGWYKLLLGDQCVGKSSGPSTYHYYYPHFIASVGCFILKPSD